MPVISTQVDFELITCFSCGVHFCVPDYLKEKLIKTHNDFWCPNGHCQHFVGETESDKLRKELKRKEQELANIVIEKLDIQSKFNKMVADSGNCPCCNKTFKALKNHIRNKHPHYKTLTNGNK